MTEFTVSNSNLGEITTAMLDIGENNMVPAIRIVRMITGWGLKDGKDYVEAVKAVNKLKVGDCKTTYGFKIRIVAIHPDKTWLWIEGRTPTPSDPAFMNSMTPEEWNLL